MEHPAHKRLVNLLLFKELFNTYRCGAPARNAFRNAFETGIWYGIEKETTMPEPVLRSQDLHKSFGHRKVLKGVHFSVYPGTLVGIVGENGAGKSTLLRILAGE